MMCAALAAALGIASCRREAKDFEALCNVVERSGVPANADPSERSQRISRWVEHNVRSERAMRAWRAVAFAPPEQKRAIIERAAREAGYDGPCPLFGAEGAVVESNR
jgi:hypothetical protein